MPRIQVGDTHIYYEQHGAGDDVLLIQGLGANHRFWAPLLPPFTREFRVTLFDWRGTGLSDKPDKPVTTRMLAADAAGLLDVLGIARAHVVGRSMGGCIAQHLAIERPERVRSLLLAATWAKADAMLRRVLKSWADILERMGMESLMEQAFFWCFPRGVFEPEGQRELSLIGEVVGDAAKLGQPADAFRRLSTAGQEHDAVSELGRIQAPTLVMVGSEDILTPIHLARVLAEGIPKARLRIVPGGGHAFYEHMPALFAEEAIEFWKAH